MSDGGSSSIRLRLHFDYPPPAAADCRRCWLLVDRSRCRVVADLESLIRDKFGFSRGSVLSLFVQDCYLPHTESVYVVRDDDSVRVKVDPLPQVNGHSSCPASGAIKHRKRKSVLEEENQDSLRRKKKKRSKREGQSEEQDTAEVSEWDGSKETSTKSPKKIKKKKKKDSGRTCPSVSPPPDPLAQDCHTPSSLWAEDNTASPHSKACLPSRSPHQSIIRTKPAPPTTPSKPPHKPEPLQSLDSSQKLTAASSLDSSHTSQMQQEEQQEQEDEEEEEEIQLVIHPPRHQRGESRGGGRGHWRVGFKSSTEHEVQTTTPVVLQNGTPQQDYTLMPLLAAPPQVGQKIAFKLLELTENYTPEVSEYKEGKIISFDLTTKQIELELLTASQAPSGPGKFDLVYQDPDGSERVEYAVSRGSRVTELWETLLEPRLII
ncbi:unnamed protein product [Ophioblennius macclurei]